jgi:hypothetical protein
MIGLGRVVVQVAASEAPMIPSAEDPTMVYALAGLASLVALLLAWRAYRQAAEEHRRRKHDTRRR